MENVNTRKYIKIQEIEKTITNGKLLIRVHFQYSESLSKYIILSHFESEYDISENNIPDSIAYIPLVANLLPIVWLMDVELYVPILDEDFYCSIENIKKGYKLMYPSLNFNGQVITATEKSDIVLEKALVFFSGGVDAFATLFAHIDEKPTLFSIHGADVQINDLDGWLNAFSSILNVANTFSLETSICKSNFRKILDESQLTFYINQLGIDDNWWHAIQHSIGMIPLVAPIAYARKIKKVYFASTFTINERDKFTCASDPRVDEEVRFFGANVYHDQFEFNRQQKIEHIVNYVRNQNKDILLRVCWQSNANGKNCCKCEKCLRTIYGLLAENMLPNKFGFDISKAKLVKNTILFLLWHSHDPMTIKLWMDIQTKFKQTKIYNHPIYTYWIYFYNFNKPAGFLTKLLRKLLSLVLSAKKKLKNKQK